VPTPGAAPLAVAPLDGAHAYSRDDAVEQLLMNVEMLVGQLTLMRRQHIAARIQLEAALQRARLCTCGAHSFD